MHPDQRTPDSHRHHAPDSQSADDPTANAPSGQAPDAEQPDLDAEPVAAEVEDGARVAEAGNAYVGRMMDDALKSSPRVEDGDEAVDEDPSTARDD